VFPGPCLPGLEENNLVLVVLESAEFRALSHVRLASADVESCVQSALGQPEEESVAMRMLCLLSVPAIFAIMAVPLGISTAVHADEGMWVFNHLPLESLKKHYGFEPPKGWAERLRSAAVRFNNGGSGSFVSASGLIMTNHHVGADTLAKLGTASKDYYRDGFLALRLEDEAKAPDLELNALVAIEDVTDRVNHGVSSDMGDAQAGVERRRAMAQIETEATAKNGLRNDVVTLYQGGQYHLYTYKKYTDVRLVFAPEFDIAFFGGDPDNFEYPRYDLDVCFFRAYENGQPARIKDYLRWSATGINAGDLIFVAGHPGRTDRLNTVASLKFLRDVDIPLRLDLLKSREAFLLDYGRRTAEAFRQSKEELFGVQNSRKARIGGLAGLHDLAFMKRKTLAEDELRSKVQASPDRHPAATAYAWEKVAQAQVIAASIIKPYLYLERRYAFGSELFKIARDLVRLAQEKAKPNSERLKEYRDSGLTSLELELFSDAPLYPEFEEAKLAHSLADWQLALPNDPLVARVLRGRSPAQAAKELIEGSTLFAVSSRRKLAEGGLPAIAKSSDPLIKLAHDVDADARAVRKKYEDQVEGVERTNYALIARALFDAQGASVYPDATFTLRLAFGTVKGYELNGREIAPFTTMGGAFEHARAHGDKPPYELPKSWLHARDSGALDSRYHWRQLRQPGCQSRQRGGGPDF
jgi:hypothetical protein